MQSVYVAGILVSLLVYLAIGTAAGRKVKSVDDYYVAGRNAPTILIVGSLVASFISTGAFMGDTGEVYSGIFVTIAVVGVLQATGYLFGASFFGRYVRRSRALTISDYFGKRFCDRRVQALAAVTTIVAVMAYMLSAIQGVATLMSAVTGFGYSTCVIVAWVSFAVFTVWSGSSGVLITDTVMFLVFLVAAIVGIPFIVDAAGGWLPAIRDLATSDVVPGILSAFGNPDYVAETGEGLAWAVVYGVVWAFVVMVSPWQTSRYLMAKDEKTVLKSAVWSSAMVILVTMALYFSAAFMRVVNPSLSDPSQVIVWAAINVMPLIVGVILLTGILAAGISSAATFLSLIGFSLMNDIVAKKGVDEKKNLRASRAGMLAGSLVVLVLAYLNPPQIFIIMYFGGTVIASSWAVVAIASVWCRRLSGTGAFLGMLFGFAACCGLKIFGMVSGVSLPLWADPFIVGVVFSAVGCVVGSVAKPVSGSEEAQYDALHSAGEEVAGVRKYGIGYAAFGVAFALAMLALYAIPYSSAVA